MAARPPNASSGRTPAIGSRGAWNASPIRRGPRNDVRGATEDLRRAAGVAKWMTKAVDDERSVEEVHTLELRRRGRENLLVGVHADPKRGTHRLLPPAFTCSP